MSDPIRLAVVGLGKIARDQHLGAINRNPDFDLVCGVDPHAGNQFDFPVFNSVDSLLQSGIAFDAVALCTPPQVRKEICAQVLGTGRALLLEKPPASDLASAYAIEAMAKESGSVLFAAWHSRYSAHIAAARLWVQQNRIVRGTIEWRENPEKWHPGQDWLWRAGGFGVFDPGINALSMLTEICPENWRVSNCLLIVPDQAQAPRVADFSLSAGAAKISVCFEFHQRKDEIWRLQLVSETGGTLEISDGDALLTVDGYPLSKRFANEYDGVYSRFASLIYARQSDFDLAPMRIVEEAIQKGLRDSQST